MKKYKCSKYRYILYLCSAQFVSFFFVQRFKSTLRPSLQESDMKKIICILGSLIKLAPINYFIIIFLVLSSSPLRLIEV